MPGPKVLPCGAAKPFSIIRARGRIILMLRRKSAATLLMCLLIVTQLSCRSLLGDRSGETGKTSGGRPAPHFKPGFNLFTPEQDMELGRRSAQQIAQQVPLLRDEKINNYVSQLGKRLAEK